MHLCASLPGQPRHVAAAGSNAQSPRKRRGTQAKHGRESDLTATRWKQPARLVHKMILSRAAGSTPEKGLTAVKNFARVEFALKHHYS